MYTHSPLLCIVRASPTPLFLVLLQAGGGFRSGESITSLYTLGASRTEEVLQVFSPAPFLFCCCRDRPTLIRFCRHRQKFFLLHPCIKDDTRKLEHTRQLSTLLPKRKAHDFWSQAEAWDTIWARTRSRSGGATLAGIDTIKIPSKCLRQSDWFNYCSALGLRLLRIIHPSGQGNGQQETNEEMNKGKKQLDARSVCVCMCLSPTRLAHRTYYTVA